MKTPFFLRALALATASLATSMAMAQTTPIKFQLDWRFEGPAALFLTPAAKGYFKDAKLDVTIDAGPTEITIVSRVNWTIGWIAAMGSKAGLLTTALPA